MPPASPQTGDTAPQLHLPTVDGPSFDLVTLWGQHVLASFLRHAG
jgi:peroxiredoxin